MAHVDDPKPEASQATAVGPNDNGNRQFKRTAVLWKATLDCGEAPLDCQVYNFSAGGAKLRMSEPITRRSVVQLQGNRFGALPARIIWQQDDWVGLSFLDEPTKVADNMGSVLSSAAA